MESIRSAKVLKGMMQSNRNYYRVYWGYIGIMENQWKLLSRVCWFLILGFFSQIKILWFLLGLKASLCSAGIKSGVGA